jgi:hypothetical protein
MPTEKLTIESKKDEEPKGGLKNFLSKHKRVIIVFVLLALIAIPTIEMIYILSVKGLFSYFAGKVVNTGVNPYLAKAIVLFLMVPLLWSFKWAFSFRSQRRKAGYAIIAGYIVLFYMSMFFLTREQKFDFATGKAMKFYAHTPEGIRYFDAPGFDPKYGIPLKPVDPGVARSQSLSTLPPKKLDQPSQFFDFATKEPLVWYYKGADGTVEFFDQPGFHPKYAQELKPVTPEIVEEFEKQQVEKMKSLEKKNPAKKIDAPKEFFDSASKKPLVWYYEGPDGDFEFFDRPGFHPKYAEELKPVTPQVVQKYEMKLEKARKQKTEAEQKRIEDEQGKRREALGATTGKYEAPSSFYPSKQEQPQARITPEQIIQGLRGAGQSHLPQMDAMKSFISSYLKANENKEMDKVLSFYGDTVDYYSNGMVLKSYIRKDKEKYFDFCRKLSYILADDLRITNSGNPEKITLMFTYSFFIESLKKNVSGTAINTWDIENASSNPKIIAEKQTVIDRKESKNLRY